MEIPYNRGNNASTRQLYKIPKNFQYQKMGYILLSHCQRGPI